MKQDDISHPSRLEIDLQRYQVRRNGQSVHLTRTEWALLREFIRQDNQILSHNFLLQKVWGEVYETESNYLYVYIARLRKKLEEDPANPQYLLTEPGIGYRWSTRTQVSLVKELSNSHLPNSPSLQITDLPMLLTSFIGRAKEMTILQNLLQEKDMHLLTLTGPGGVGKTRLAVQVATNLRNAFEHGVYFIDLIPVHNANFTIAAIAQLFELRETTDQPLMERLKVFLSDKHLLLILDNFEHVQAAGPLVAELLVAAPRTKFLVTSRERLHLYGERSFEVPPLSLVDPPPLSPNEVNLYCEAVSLFVARAQAIRPDFVLTKENASIVKQICAQVDGLPLAIELAAGRSNLLTPHALLARLEDRLNILTGGQKNLHSRHQTLRATIDWSYQLLEEVEQLLFAQLGVFVGGFTLEAAEAVCHLDNQTGISLLDGLSSLLDKSLLRQQSDITGELRYMMLDSFREYALEQFKISGEIEELSRRHAQYYLALAERFDSQLTAMQQDIWLNILKNEVGNLRAALKWSLAYNETAITLRMSSALYEFWWRLGYLTEGCQWLNEALNNSANTPAPVRAHALYRAGGLADWLGNHEQALGFYKESLTLYRLVEDTEGVADVLNVLGLAIANHGDYTQAKSLCEESLGMARARGNKHRIAQSLNSLGIIALYQSAFVRARMLYEEQMSLCKELENNQGIAWSLTGLSWAELSQGNHDLAKTFGEESLALHRESGDMPGIALALTCLGWIALYRADLSQSLIILEKSLSLCRDLGLMALSVWSLIGLGSIALYQNKVMQAKSLFEESLKLCQQLKFLPIGVWAYIGLGKAALLEGNCDLATAYHKQSLSLYHELGDKGAIASAIEELGAIAVVQNQIETAAQLYGMAEMLRDAYKIPQPPIERAYYDDMINTIRSFLKEATWTSAWTKGRTMPMDQIVTYILSN